MMRRLRVAAVVERGFTFVEMLVVVALVAILASAVMPLARVTMQRQREIELRRALREMRTAIDRYKDAVDQGAIPATKVRPGSEGYPPDLETLVVGVEAAGQGIGAQAQVPAPHPDRPDDPRAGVGHARRTTTSRTPSRGAARTSTTSTARAKAPRSTARSTRTGSDVLMARAGRPGCDRRAASR